MGMQNNRATCYLTYYDEHNRNTAIYHYNVWNVNYPRLVY